MSIKKTLYSPVPDWAKSGPKKSSQYGWEWIVLRDIKRCVYCLKDLSVNIDGILSITQDHLFPTSLGGEEYLANIVTACIICNRLKGHSTPDPKNWKSRKTYIQACRELIDIEREARIKRFKKYIGPRPSEVFDSKDSFHQGYL